jgi:hypothetical protein
VGPTGGVGPPQQVRLQVSSVAPIAVNTAGSNSGDLGPPQQVRLGLNSVAPIVVNTVCSNNGDLEPPQQVRLGLNSVAPIVVNTVGSNSGGLEPPQQVRLGLNSVAPIVVNTVGSNNGDLEPPQQVRLGLNSVAPIVVNTVGSNNDDLEPPQQVRLGLNSVAPIVVNTVGSNNDDLEPPQQVRLGLNSVAPILVNTVGSNSGDLEPPQQVRLGSNSVAPIVVNTVGSNSGCDAICNNNGTNSISARTSCPSSNRKRAWHFFDGNDLSKEVAHVAATARLSKGPRSVMHHVTLCTKGAQQHTNQGEQHTVTSKIVAKLSHDASHSYIAAQAKLVPDSVNSRGNSDNNSSVENNTNSLTTTQHNSDSNDNNTITNNNNSHVTNDNIKAIQIKNNDQFMHTLSTTASVLLDTHKNISAVIHAIGGTLLAPHLNTDIIARHFSRGNGFDDLNLLKEMSQRGLNIAVQFGGNLPREIEFGNYASTVMHDEAFRKKVIDDIKSGKAVAVTKQAALQHLAHCLRVAPAGVIQERIDKYRVIHDLSTEKVGEASVNTKTNFDDAPPCGCGTVLLRLLLRIWQLRQQWPTKRMMLSKMDVTAAFRQLRVNTDGVLFGYIYDDLGIIDLRLQFGWRSSPGWWELINNALMWSHAQIRMHSMPELVPAAVAVRNSITVEPDSGATITTVRDDPLARQQLQGSDAESASFEHHYRSVGQQLAATALGTGTVVKYSSNWRQWCDFCDKCRRHHYLVDDDDQDKVEMLMAYVGYCYEDKKINYQL